MSKAKFLLICGILCVGCFCLAFLFVTKSRVPDENNRLYEAELETIDEVSQVEEKSIVVSDITISNPVALEETVTEEQTPTEYKWFYTDVYVEPFDMEKEHVLVLEYGNMSSIIIEALLYTGNLEQSISKDTLSEEGKLVFPLTIGKEGTYRIVLYGTGDIGGYHTYVLPKEDYINLQKPNVEYPRDRMREDALIDE